MPNNNGTQSALAYTTRCKLFRPDGSPCGFQVTDNPLDAMVVGQPDRRTMKFMQAIMEHTAKRHKDALELAQQLQGFFLGWLMIGNFDAPDPAIQNVKLGFEADMRRRFTPLVSDADIESSLGAMGLTMDDPHREPFRKALQHMRDFYEGKTPQQTTNSAPSHLIHP
jgi:hypothetical protein